MLMINKAIAEATEESHKISTLRANGLLDADACAVRMNVISAKLTQLRGERRRLSENEALDETMDAIRKMTAVIKNGPEQMKNLQTVHQSAFFPLYLSYHKKQDQQPCYLGEVYVLYHHLKQLRSTSCQRQVFPSYKYLQQGAGIL